MVVEGGTQKDLQGPEQRMPSCAFSFFKFPGHIKIQNCSFGGWSSVITNYKILSLDHTLKIQHCLGIEKNHGGRQLLVLYKNKWVNLKFWTKTIIIKIFLQLERCKIRVRNDFSLYSCSIKMSYPFRLLLPLDLLCRGIKCTQRPVIQSNHIRSLPTVKRVELQ